MFGLCSTCKIDGVSDLVLQQAVYAGDETRPPFDPVAVNKRQRGFAEALTARFEAKHGETLRKLKVGTANFPL